jgi:hypothetical protein
MQQNLSRYRVLELFAESVAKLDLAGADLEVVLNKIKRQAKKALNHKAPPRNEKLAEARAKARASTKLKAATFRATALPLIAAAQKAGARSTRQIAEWLNNEGHVTARGFAWSSAAVHRILNPTAED